MKELLSSTNKRPRIKKGVLNEINRKVFFFGTPKGPCLPGTFKEYSIDDPLDGYM